MQKMSDSVLLKAIYCKGVKNFILFQKPSFYAVVKLVAGDRRISSGRTDVDRSGGENPDWDEPIQFELDRAGSDRDLLDLEFEIRDQCNLPILSDKLVGRAIVPVNDLVADGPAGSASYQIQAPDGKPNGVLTFSYRIDAPDAAIPLPPSPEAIGSFYSPSAPPDPGTYLPPPERAYACSSQFYPPVFDPPPPPDAFYPAPATSYPPPASSYPQPESSYQPPESSYHPPATSYPPLESYYPPPGTSYPRAESPYPPPGTSYPRMESPYPPPGTSYPAPGTMYRSVEPPVGEYYPPPGTGHVTYNPPQRPACYHPAPHEAGSYRMDGWDRGLYGCN